METVTQGDDSSLNIQNEYFNKARKNRTRITVVLTNGQRISGFIRSFDKFTLILDTRHGDQMVFKHAISTVAPSGQGDRDHRSPRPSHAEKRGGPGRPSHGRPKEREAAPSAPAQGDMRQRAAASPSGKSFGNFMDLSSLAKSPAGSDAASPAKKDAAPETASGAGGPEKEGQASPAGGAAAEAAKESKPASSEGAAVESAKESKPPKPAPPSPPSGTPEPAAGEPSKN